MEKRDSLAKDFWNCQDFGTRFSFWAFLTLPNSEYIFDLWKREVKKEMSFVFNDCSYIKDWSNLENCVWIFFSQMNQAKSKAGNKFDFIGIMAIVNRIQRQSSFDSWKIFSLKLGILVVWRVESSLILSLIEDVKKNKIFRKSYGLYWEEQCFRISCSGCCAPYRNDIKKVIKKLIF